MCYRLWEVPCAETLVGINNATARSIMHRHFRQEPLPEMGCQSHDILQKTQWKMDPSRCLISVPNDHERCRTHLG